MCGSLDSGESRTWSGTVPANRSKRRSGVLLPSRKICVKLHVCPTFRAFVRRPAVRGALIYGLRRQTGAPTVRRDWELVDGQGVMRACGSRELASRSSATRSLTLIRPRCRGLALGQRNMFGPSTSFGNLSQRPMSSCLDTGLRVTRADIRGPSVVRHAVRPFRPARDLASAPVRSPGRRAFVTAQERKKRDIVPRRQNQPACFDP